MEKNGLDKKFKNLSQERELDCTNAEEALWLVKVPKYISSRWEKVASGGEGGRLQITTGPDGKPDIKFTVADDPSTRNAPSNIPTEHKFVVSNIRNQSLAVYSEITSESNSGSSGAPGKLTLEGHVNERCEMRPVADKKYMMLKRQSIIQAQEPEHKVMHLARAVHSFKPVNSHKHIIEAEQKKKQEGKKARDDKEKVQEMLFGAFEEHQYYNIKDLERITKQPMVYLKEILKEICNYNAKNPHKNMWELKPEYRCYKAQEKEGTED